MAGGYLVAGVHHILLGVDHLVFVLGLLLLVKDRWVLVKTISAFTLAHSITLAIATLGYAGAPAAALNAAIALSILFLGPEIVRAWRGGTSLTIRHPWLVASCSASARVRVCRRADHHGSAARGDPAGAARSTSSVEAGSPCSDPGPALERAFPRLEVRWPGAGRCHYSGLAGAYWTIQRVAMLLGGAR